MLQNQFFITEDANCLIGKGALDDDVKVLSDSFRKISEKKKTWRNGPIRIQLIIDYQ